jgi:intracellular sulfur oxidation DsrE/DsrF family protein
MNRRLFIQAGALASLAAVAPMLMAQTAAAKRNRIVIQVSDNDPAKWNLALNNAKNLQEDVGAANVDIEIVAYGPGIGMLKLESPTGSRVADAMKANVKVIACENTMRGQKLTKDDMLPAISYVPAGVTEIMTRQTEGWAYLRP